MTDPQPLGFDAMAVVRAAPAMRRTDPDGAIIIGPVPWELPQEMRRTLPDGTEGYDFMSAFGALWGSASMLFNQIQPLKSVADEMPTIVAHSDQVHTELQQGLDAIRTAVGAVQTAANSLSASLGPISQVAAQAQAAAAIANATATAAGQRCTALEARCTSLETKVANHETRIAVLEARRVQMWRAAGNLPTLAMNATVDVSCPWTSAVPSPLPSLDQCQVFVAGAAIPTVKTVAASAVTVTLRATGSLLPAPGAVQVAATTWS